MGFDLKPAEYATLHVDDEAKVLSTDFTVQRMLKNAHYAHLGHWEYPRPLQTQPSQTTFPLKSNSKIHAPAHGLRSEFTASLKMNIFLLLFSNSALKNSFSFKTDVWPSPSSSSKELCILSKVSITDDGLHPSSVIICPMAGKTDEDIKDSSMSATEPFKSEIALLTLSIDILA